MIYLLGGIFFYLFLGNLTLYFIVVSADLPLGRAGSTDSVA